MLSDDDKRIFQAILDSAKSGKLALVACKQKTTGEAVSVICGVSSEGDQTILAPFAQLFLVNPYETIIPPTQEEEPARIVRSRSL